MSEAEVAVKRIPFWARVLIGATVFFIIAGSGFLVMTSMAVVQYLRESTSASRIEKTLNEIALFGPLPSTFKWAFAMSTQINDETAGVALADYNHENNHSRMIITRLAANNRRKFTDPNVLISRLAVSGMANSKLDIKERGQLPVAGEVMYYGIGPVSGTSEKTQGFAGAVYPSNSDKVIVLFGGTAGDTYDMDATKEFLSTIKSF